MGRKITPLRAARLLGGLSLHDVGARVGIFPSRLSRIERNQIRIYADEARALSSFFNLPVYMLFPGIEDQLDPAIVQDKEDIPKKAEAAE
ncbi:MAG: helix-turn-helix transcriptional regulator [Candidatus Aminicenantales bacterium]